MTRTRLTIVLNVEKVECPVLLEKTSIIFVFSIRFFVPALGYIIYCLSFVLLYSEYKKIWRNVNCRSLLDFPFFC
jgi:hypothetical protein